MTTSTISSPRTPRTRFLSLRWRLLLPLGLTLMIAAMLGTYLLSSQLTGGFAIAEQNITIQSSLSALTAADEHFQRLQAEARRVAYTIGVAESVEAAKVDTLIPVLRSAASAAGLDSLIALDMTATEIGGLLLSGRNYTVSSGTNLNELPAVNVALRGETTAGLLRTPEGLMLVTAVPLRRGDQLIGAVIAGESLSESLDSFQTSALSEVTLYDVDAGVLGSTFALDGVLSDLMLDPAVIEQTLSSSQPLMSGITIGGEAYRAVLRPFDYGPVRLGVLGVTLPDQIPAASMLGRQLSALTASALAGTAIIIVFMGVSAMTARMQRVNQTAEALLQGKRQARTGMRARDEVGAIGFSLDRYADTVQVREDQFRSALHRQRREMQHLVSVLESIPDGVIVQDREGGVLFTNERARVLLGTQTGLDMQTLEQVQRSMSELIGEALAPGVYALGDPQQVAYDGRMLTAQAAAVVSRAGTRIGSVIVLRDITEEVREQQEREALYEQLSREVQMPLGRIAQTTALEAEDDMAAEVAREIARHAAALQQMIVAMRELTRYGRRSAYPLLRPLHTETLVWALANDWRQIAQAAGLKLQVQIERRDLYILGDEARLRWAIGNVIDNAIKYTPAGGTVSIEIKDEVDGAIHMRVRDNGMGISSEDLPHIFLPFYRGRPVDENGQMIVVPGMGQGLPQALRVIQAHGGIIRVKSRVGVGTAVYFALPLTSPVGYELPALDSDEMEGDTVLIPEHVDIEQYWKR